MSRLRTLIDTPGELIVTGEAPTVDRGTLEGFNERLAEMGTWVDAINATDNPTARAHASNVAVAIAIAQAGFEPVLQVVCRDKNRLACQADIVGAALHGIEAICCLTGDDVTAGDEPESRRVFDLDGPQLVAVAQGISEGHYLSGRDVGGRLDLLIGAVENPGAHPLDYRSERATIKARAGARFLQLQICFHPERLEAFVATLERAGLTDRVAILPTIVLLRNARALRFVNEKVPGVSVPAEIIDRLERSRDEAEEAYALALEQARHALALPGVRGLHLTDFRHDGAVSRLFNDLGIPNREERCADAHRSALAV